MNNGHGKREQRITVGLIAAAIVLLSSLPLWAGTASYVYDSTGQLKWAKDGTSGKSCTVGVKFSPAFACPSSPGLCYP
jgi:hypothetical protein